MGDKDDYLWANLGTLTTSDKYININTGYNNTVSIRNIDSGKISGISDWPTTIYLRENKNLNFLGWKYITKYTSEENIDNLSDFEFICDSDAWLTNFSLYYSEGVIYASPEIDLYYLDKDGVELIISEINSLLKFLEDSGIMITTVFDLGPSNFRTFNNPEDLGLTWQDFKVICYDSCSNKNN